MLKFLFIFRMANDNSGYKDNSDVYNYLNMYVRPFVLPYIPTLHSGVRV